jgi:ribose transport system permease protein
VSSTPATVAERPESPAQTVMRTFRDRPVVPLLILLALLALAFIGLNPRTNVTEWVASTLRAAIPLAILAGCQTIVMLTGGIDLSVAATASMSAFVAASLLEQQGLAVAIIVPLVIAVIIGVINGIGQRRLPRAPADHDPGHGPRRLRGIECLAAADRQDLVWGATRDPPDRIRDGARLRPRQSRRLRSAALIIVIGLRRTGYGRLLYAIGDNPIAARLSGARSWQVLVVLYAISAVLAAIAGYLISGFTNVASVTLADSYLLPSVAAAVIGGTSIFGGRGGYTGTIVGALILTVATSLLFSLGFPEAVRQILFGLLIVLVAAGYARVTGET